MNTYKKLNQHFSDTNEIPKGKEYHYKCLKCCDIVKSLPKDNIGCSCGNIFVDIDMWRLWVEDLSQFAVLEENNK